MQKDQRAGLRETPFSKGQTGGFGVVVRAVPSSSLVVVVRAMPGAEL
jgi:hypothetical protein